MTVCGAVFCRLILISTLVGDFTEFAHADDDVCQGKKLEHLIHFLETDEVDKMQGHIESKVLLSQLLQSNLECKAQNLIQTKKIDKITETLDQVQAQRLVDASKMDKMVETLDIVLKKVLENAETAKKEMDCQKDMCKLTDSQAKFFSASGKMLNYNATTKMNWYEAQNYCQEMGMQMATLKTLTQIESASRELKSLITAFGTNCFWLSASDIGRTTGQYQWADGTAVDSGTWESGYPAKFKAGQEACVFLDTTPSKLRDWDCSLNGTLYPLCEASCV